MKKMKSLTLIFVTTLMMTFAYGQSNITVEQNLTFDEYLAEGNTVDSFGALFLTNNPNAKWNIIDGTSFGLPFSSNNEIIIFSQNIQEGISFKVVDSQGEEYDLSDSIQLTRSVTFINVYKNGELENSYQVK